MSTYENSYFGFKIDFPKGWRHRYFGNRKDLPGKHSEHYHASESDLPIAEDSHKELFFAFKRVMGSPSVMSCTVGMAALYRKNNYDLNLERMPDRIEIAREHGKTDVMGIDANYLYLELAFDKYTCFRRFTYWQHTSNIWLNFAIEGDTEENYVESEFLVSGIKKI